MKIFVVIPAYNEARRIGAVLTALAALAYEVVVVDDGSSDNTAAVVSQHPVKLLRHRLNRQQGAALETGNQYALKHGADIIVHFDGDGQYLAEEIKDIVAPIEAGECDIVFGSRFMVKRSQMPWLKKNIYFPLARLFNRIFLGIKFSDPQNGFRALSRKAAAEIQIEQDGMAHCSEIAAKTVKLGLRSREIPITVIYHEFGQGLSGGLKIVRDLLISKLLK